MLIVYVYVMTDCVCVCVCVCVCGNKHACVFFVLFFQARARDKLSDSKEPLSLAKKPQISLDRFDPYPWTSATCSCGWY
jgi:hypothetical protein